ncbi:solute carrier family 10 (sodium/bile acid cotransporter), member 7 [Variovorax sp. HW608]|uniref:bile acid:sodium symporter family protein n=1 Tax=Variovorax sp. HW608 TaxID=1034889 RepID=UPI00081FABBC|nr:bile acid:sodium symporter family protein [Variovorax sp. HW608]SCK62149.1 solute carrier family 10 (sodium/bile acid cotransporter), member 7 [Variovorax sp. HW608]
MARSRYLPDNFTIALVVVVALASLWPASGGAAHFFERLTTFAIGLLFFLHGAKLSREAILGGITHWRLHVLVFAATFVMFPLLGLALKPVLTPLVTPELYTGVLFLCVLPATVQSAIAFTSMARGNIPAAVCSASASTMLGVFVTPILVNLIVVQHGAAGASLDAVGRILLQLMVPFVAGHLLRPWIGGWIRKRGSRVTLVDRGSILLVVYTAFSAAVIEGLWKQVPLSALIGLIVVCGVLLGLALAITAWAGRALGFDKADQITIVFCGSKKSLASGIPMAKVLFASHAVGAIVLPLMLFHQMQLMVCAVLAQRYARRPAEPVEAGPARTPA